MFIAYFILAAILVGANTLAKSRDMVRWISLFFYLAQAAFGLLMATSGVLNQVSSTFFTLDIIGMLFFGLMCVVSIVAFLQSNYYLDSETLHQYKVYNNSLIMLCASAAGVYFANHIVVTWIFLEITTLSTAGLVYHRRNARSLEATWKYIFVCSTGIAIAYLGILLLSTAAVRGDMSYQGLMATVQYANPLYLKIAFLFIMVGYSCKMETFPFYTVGVDANFAAPSPASAVISTVLVNAGFVSFFRVYRLITASGVASWMSSVIIIAGMISVLIGAVYMRRTNSYKRFFSYSTVENMGIALIGLGVGGAGVFAAVFHVLAHTLIKSGMFFNIATIGKIYGNYRINRIGNYMAVSNIGSMSVLMGTISLLAFPPSALFISEMIILREIISAKQWVVLVITVLLLCFLVYSLCSRLLQLLYKQVDVSQYKEQKINKFVVWSSFILILLSMVMGTVQPTFLVDWINSIIIL